MVISLVLLELLIALFYGDSGTVIQFL